MLGQLVCPWILWTPFPMMFMLWQNRSSSVGRNVAVIKTICTFNRTNSPNWRILGRKFGRLANTVWHSSMTIRSNWWVACNKFTNSLNPLVNADSGVTKTTDADSTAWSLRYIEHVMPPLSHRRFKSPCNATNGTTTMVVPPWEQNASNMKIKLFLAPVPITTNIGLVPFMTDWIARF